VKAPRPRRRARAALGSAVFLILAPGVVAGWIPWSITGWRMEPTSPVVRVLGGMLILAGLAFLVHAFARFVVEGMGTPAPVAPTERLVIGGVYRYVRNPMYLAVGATIAGQALLFGQPALLVYAAAFGAVVFCFVRFYEEPALSGQFGAGYDSYRSAVPGWLPRRRPWQGEDGGSTTPQLPRQADRPPVQRAHHRFQSRP
jgi:protein-S-isoprenylcysteine O-methyltransferase Ste14